MALRATVSPQHRRQSLWQIWIPLAITVAVILALAIWVSLLTFRNAQVGSEWADISTIFLVALYFVPALLILALLAAGIFVLARMLRVVPYYALRVTTFIYHLEGSIIQFANSGAKPIITLISGWAGLRTLLKDLGLRSRETR